MFDAYVAGQYCPKITGSKHSFLRRLFNNNCPPFEKEEDFDFLQAIIELSRIDLAKYL